MQSYKNSYYMVNAVKISKSKDYRLLNFAGLHD